MSNTIFTPHIKTLQIDAWPPEALLDNIAQVLRANMRKRPAMLYPQNHWEDLLFDCYEFAVVKRIERLRDALNRFENIDGLIFRNINYFLTEQQSRHDPIGYSVAVNAQKAVQQAVELGELIAQDLDKNGQINNNTLLTFSSAQSTGNESSLSDGLRRNKAWADIRLKLVRRSETAQESLYEIVCQLPESGIKRFQFKDLVNIMTNDVRVAWQSFNTTLDNENTALEDNNKMPRLVKLAAGIEQKRADRIKKLSQRPKHPQPGDLFAFDIPETLGLQWAVLMPHPDNEQLLFTVPADDNPMVGSTDIAISENALCGPLTLRCDRGVWIHQTDFNMTGRVGFLENGDLQCALEQVKHMFNGTLQSTTWQMENDADPYYDEWMSQVVSRGQFALENAVQEISSEDMETLDVIQLNDFEWIKTSQDGPIFAWRLDRQREVCLALSKKEGTARLIQSYNDGQNWNGDVLWPIFFQQHRFDFVDDEGQGVCQITPAWVREIAKAFNFNLPEPLQEPTTWLSRLVKNVLEDFSLSLLGSARPVMAAAAAASATVERVINLDNGKRIEFSVNEDGIGKLTGYFYEPESVKVIVVDSVDKVSIPIGVRGSDATATLELKAQQEVSIWLEVTEKSHLESLWIEVYAS
ncbi:MAG: hypothetical protein ABFS56_14315 [Pseudomonadota bacterium]